MPASTTSAPLSLLSSIIFARLSRSVATGWPRKPVVAAELDDDELRIVHVRASAASRASPPADVSPAMLAFTT